MKSALLSAFFVCLSAMILTPSSAHAWDEPIWTDDGLVYPEGADIPAFLTDFEQAYISQYPITAADTRGRPPEGPIHCVAEYEPMEGIMIAWESFTTILRQIALHTTTTGNSDIYVVVDSSGEQSTAYSSLNSYGVDMNRVKFVVRGTDTVWIRDYGPRYIYEGDCRAIVDHTYNRPRPNDDALSAYFATVKHHAIYDIPLVHGGGNFHLNGLDEGNATRLIASENPSLTDQQIIDHWYDFQNLDTTLWTPFPTYVDSTQHIDMWMQIVGDDVIMISDWPYNSGSTQDNICDATAADFTSRGWTVYRIPARTSGAHFTYTNMIVCNDVAMIPSYASYSAHNAEALAAYQAALPGKTVVQVNCDDIIWSAGALHCICMHVPAPIGGVNPTAYLRTLRGGETLEPGTDYAINWITDDDVAVTSIDILLSTDGGLTFPTEIVTGTADDGGHTWTAPDIYTQQARIRLVVHDADGNTGYDESDSNLIINGVNPCPQDVDGDGDVDLSDLALLLSAYGACSGDGNFNPAVDFDGSGCIDLSDLSELLSVYGGPCP